jgi:hypothetical protein
VTEENKTFLEKQLEKKASEQVQTPESSDDGKVLPFPGPNQETEKVEGLAVPPDVTDQESMQKLIDFVLKHYDHEAIVLPVLLSSQIQSLMISKLKSIGLNESHINAVITVAKRETLFDDAGNPRQFTVFNMLLAIYEYMGFLVKEWKGDANATVESCIEEIGGSLKKLSKEAENQMAKEAPPKSDK